MFLFQTIRMCLKNVFANKLRSFLTMLGIIIGISSVIILVGFTQGTSDDISSSLNGLGANVITVSIYNDDTTTLNYDDIKDLTTSFASDILMVNQSRGNVKYSSTSANYTVVGTTSNFLNVNKFSLSDGRMISTLDIDNASNVAIIGADSASNLFGTTNPIGEKLRIGTSYYTVIGVLSSGSSSDSDYNSSIIVPITTYGKVMDDSTVSTMYFVTTDENPDTTMMEKRILNSLSSYITSENIEVVTKDSVSDTISEVDEMTTLLISLIGAISLIVSGIGVMNIMIVSVSERTREIGVRKAIGASSFDILKQFLIEAVILTTFGGVLGISAGYGFSLIAGYMGISFSVNSSIVLISLAFSASIGIIFGIIPAIRAARLKPIDALKHE